MNETEARERPVVRRLPPMTEEELRQIDLRLRSSDDVVVAFDRETMIRIVDAALGRREYRNFVGEGLRAALHRIQRFT